MFEIFRTLGNIYDDSEERANLFKNIISARRRLKLIQKIVKNYGYGNHKEIYILLKKFIL